jgi:hypothetical protein
MKKNWTRFALLLTAILLLSFFTGCSTVDTPTATTETVLIADSTAETEIADEINKVHLDKIKASLSKWGLGQNLISYVGNNRNYEWYIDQAHTGLHSDANCGPASVAMAARWANQNTTATAEVARDAYRSSGGWWYSDDINNALDLFNIDYEVIQIDDLYDLRAIIDSGSIAIINNSMGYIPENTDEAARVNRFYSFDSGHYLIIKGYLLVDNYTYFEVYDPNNWDFTYSDETPKGKDRYYEATVLMNSIENWYPYAVVIKSVIE